MGGEGTIDAGGLLQLQGRMPDVLRGLATSAGPVEELAPGAFKQLLPQIYNNADQPSRAVDPTTRSTLQSIFRQACLDLSLEAQQQGRPPMQHICGKATEPVLQRLLAAALLSCKQGLIEPHGFLSLLEDIQDVSIPQHCLDIIAWLEQHVPILTSDLFAPQMSLNQFTRVCNAILKRLGKHQVVNKARLLMLIARITPLFDRSGVGITGTFSPADAPKAEDVPEGAVDSTGNPVNVLLYRKFWDLQSMLQDPLLVLTSLDKWATFKKELGAVLDEMLKSPATVPASRPVAAAVGSNAFTAGTEGAAVAAAGVASAASDASGGGDVQAEGAGTQCYLSSWKLFGLQLTDASFRRDFLVQVLIMLRTLLIPGKVPAETLKQKQRMEAYKLEEEVYNVLKSTPRDGERFCKAVREVLQREVTWVAWKKGNKEFVVPGKAPEAAPAAPAATNRKQPTITNCIDWSKPPVSSLSAAVAQAHTAASTAAEKKRKQIADGLELLRNANTSGRKYDNEGVPMDRPDKQRRMAVKLLGDNCSSITYWAQHKIENRALSQQPLLAGLKVSQQKDYPTADALCHQVLREMDPDSGLEKDYKRLWEDGVYRWRIGRIVAQRMPEEQNVEQPETLEDAMMLVFPNEVPPKFKEQYAAKMAAIREKQKALEQAKSAAAGRGNSTAQPASSKITLATSDADGATAEGTTATGGRTPKPDSGTGSSAAAAATDAGATDAAATADSPAGAIVKQETEVDDGTAGATVMAAMEGRDGGAADAMDVDAQ